MRLVRRRDVRVRVYAAGTLQAVAEGQPPSKGGGSSLGSAVGWRGDLFAGICQEKVPKDPLRAAGHSVVQSRWGAAWWGMRRCCVMLAYQIPAVSLLSLNLSLAVVQLVE